MPQCERDPAEDRIAHRCGSERVERRRVPEQVHHHFDDVTELG